MAGCPSFCRYVVIAVNVLFFIIGSASVGVGLMVVLDRSRLIDRLTQLSLAAYSNSIPSLLTNAAFIFLGAGAVIVLISFCGCFGAVKVITPVLIVYGIIVLVLALFEIGVITTVAAFSNQLEGVLKQAVKQSLTDHYVGGPLNATEDGAYLLPASNAITHAWDIMQVELGCCGVDGGADYNSTKAWTHKIMYNASGFAAPVSIPATCCRLNVKTDAASALLREKSVGRISVVDMSCPATLSASYYDTGCYALMKDIVRANGIVILAVSAAVVAVQVFLVVATFLLVNSKRREMKLPAVTARTWRSTTTRAAAETPPTSQRLMATLRPAAEQSQQRSTAAETAQTSQRLTATLRPAEEQSQQRFTAAETAQTSQRLTATLRPAAEQSQQRSTAAETAQTSQRLTATLRPAKSSRRRDLRQ